MRMSQISPDDLMVVRLVSLACAAVSGAGQAFTADAIIEDAEKFEQYVTQTLKGE